VSFFLVVGVAVSLSMVILCVGNAIANAFVQGRHKTDWVNSHLALNEVSIAFEASCFPLPSFNFAF
jgi:hypothetical protein